jgi:hypothetical protein
LNKYCLHIAELIAGKKIANLMKINIYLTTGSPVFDLSISSKGDDSVPRGISIALLTSTVWVRKYDTACNDKNFMLQYLTYVM